MEIEFVNHASTIFSYDKIQLITDPWIDGEVFHNGWSLISKTQFTNTDYERITHIWFSHEHPDHFFPPNIKAIPLELRKKITILYHKTNDKKVISFCEKLEFKEVIELEPNKEFELTPKFKLINTPHGHDSWLYIKTDQCTILNTNDCVINSKENAKKIVKMTGEVDILMTQFSYAKKHGNSDQPEKREKAVDLKLNQMKIQIESFKPKYFIPIASFIWFSHEENYYMNDRINTIDKVERFIEQNNTKPVILYPGETYTLDEDHDNSKSIQQYMSDYENIKADNTRKTNSIDFDKLKVSALNYKKKIKKKSFLAFLLISIFPIKLYLKDLNRTVKFSSLWGFKEIKNNLRKVNFIMTSEVLEYCFNFDWGFETTKVNGRFQTTKNRDFLLFTYYSFINSSLNHKASLKTIFDKINNVYNKK